MFKNNKILWGVWENVSLKKGFLKMTIDEMKKEVIEVYKEEKRYIDSDADLRRFTREEAEIYINKIDRMELFNELRKTYNLEQFRIAGLVNLTSSESLADLIESYNYLNLSDYIYSYIVA